MQTVKYGRNYEVTLDKGLSKLDNEIIFGVHKKSLDNLEKLCDLNSKVLVGEIGINLLNKSRPVSVSIMYLGSDGSFVVNESEWCFNSVFCESTLVLFQEGKKPEALTKILDDYYGIEKKKELEGVAFCKSAWRMF